MPTYLMLYAVSWTEFEKGWGSRPDGWTFHPSLVAAKSFVSKYINDCEARVNKGQVPHEYSRPDGEPRLVEVSQELHDKVMADGSIWLHVNSLDSYKTFTFKK